MKPLQPEMPRSPRRRAPGLPRWRTAAGLLAAIGIAGSAAAQPAHRVPDSLQQRLRACTGCHGADGRAARDGYYPRIAGKPAGYLYQQLLNFRDGRRHNGTMITMVEHLSDRYLLEIADYFAGLDLPYAPAPAPRADPAVLAAGRRLAVDGEPGRGLPACAACHGAALTGMLPSIPGLLGLPRDYLVGQLGAWRNGLRQAVAPDCMAHIALRLERDEVLAVASWLATQPLPADPRPASASPLPQRCGGMP